MILFQNQNKDGLGQTLITKLNCFPPSDFNDACGINISSITDQKQLFFHLLLATNILEWVPLGTTLQPLSTRAQSQKPSFSARAMAAGPHSLIGPTTLSPYHAQFLHEFIPQASLLHPSYMNNSCMWTLLMEESKKNNKKIVTWIETTPYRTKNFVLDVVVLWKN